MRAAVRPIRPRSGRRTNGCWLARQWGNRHVDVGAEARVHVLERGVGPPLVLLPGGGSFAGFFLPLLNQLQGIRALAPDRPGKGVSDPIALQRDFFRETAVGWLDRLLDALELDATALSPSGGSCARWPNETVEDGPNG